MATHEKMSMSVKIRLGLMMFLTYAFQGIWVLIAKDFVRTRLTGEIWMERSWGPLGPRLQRQWRPAFTRDMARRFRP